MSNLVKKLGLALLLLVSTVSITYSLPPINGPYYVRKTGNPPPSDGNDGLSWQNAWASMDRVNRTIRPGEKVYVFEGIYSVAINPDSAGNNPNGQCTYIGASLNGDPANDSTLREQIGVPGQGLTKPNVSIKGISFLGGWTSEETADQDSIIDCTILSGELRLNGSDYMTFNRLNGKGVNKFVLGEAGNQYTRVAKFFTCTFPNLGISTVAQPHSFYLRNCDSLQFVNCYRKITEQPGANDVSPQVWFQTTRTTMRNCVTEVVNNRPYTGDPTTDWTYTFVMRLRDSTFANNFRKDTLYVSGTGAGGVIYLSVDGNVNKNAFPDSAMVIDSCYWNMAKGSGTTGIKSIFRLKDLTMTQTTIVTKGAPALWIEGNYVSGKNKIRHCTFASNFGCPSYQNCQDINGIVGFGNVQNAIWPDSTIIMYDNIISDLQTPGIMNDPVPQYGSDPGTTNWPLRLCKEAAGGTLTSQKKFTVDFNLFTWMGSTTGSGNGDRSIVAKDGGNNYSLNGAPAAFVTPWALGSNNRWGSAQFRDSSLVNFNPALRVTSHAKGNGANSSDIGAVAYVTQSRIQITKPQGLTFILGIPKTDTIWVANAGDASNTIYIDASHGGGWTASNTTACATVNGTLIKDLGDLETLGAGLTVASGIATPDPGTALAGGNKVGYEIAYDGTGTISSGYFIIQVLNPDGGAFGQVVSCNKFRPNHGNTFFFVPVSIIGSAN